VGYGYGCSSSTSTEYTIHWGEWKDIFKPDALWRINDELQPVKVLGSSVEGRDYVKVETPEGREFDTPMELLTETGDGSPFLKERREIELWIARKGRKR
jgi:hypothetical protein